LQINIAILADGSEPSPVSLL